MKRKNKPVEEQNVNVGDSVVYFAQTYTVVEVAEPDLYNSSDPKILLPGDNLRIILHIKAVEYPFNSLWVKRSDVIAINEGVNDE